MDFKSFVQKHGHELSTWMISNVFEYKCRSAGLLYCLTGSLSMLIMRSCCTLNLYNFVHVHCTYKNTRSACNTHFFPLSLSPPLSLSNSISSVHCNAKKGTGIYGIWYKTTTYKLFITHFITSSYIQTTMQQFLFSHFKHILSTLSTVWWTKCYINGHHEEQMSLGYCTPTVIVEV